jgi:hypothetical protein
MLEPEEQRHEEIRQADGTRLAKLLIAAVVVVIVVGLIAFGYHRNQDAAVAELSAHQNDMNAQVSALKDQLDTVTTKLSDLTAAQAAASANTQAPAASATAKRTAKRPAPDPRWKQMQSRLDSQQKQLDDTANSVTQTRADLEGTIGSTRDELNGSIAKTHDELVALEKRGERSYFEFDLSKNKQFQRTGPISISLRKADSKHKSYDLALLVDDNQIEKKKVDLYEPIWLRDSEAPQPLEVVVNKIDKDHVHGYVSSPKFTESQLGASTVPASSSSDTQTPVANPQSN